MNIEANLEKEIKARIQFPVLLACSGGLDSMVLAKLLLVSGIPFHIGHVNYGLRGKESKADESLVTAFAKRHQIPLHLFEVDLKKQKNKGESVQMVARRIRYDWLESVRVRENLEAIVTGHHQRDQAETLLLNLSRGSGWRGAIAMKPSNGKVLRPLLAVPHTQIKAYALANQVQWREDVSNTKNNYNRNKIRNLVLPQLENINADVIQHLSDFSKQMLNLAPLLEEVIQLKLEPYRIAAGFREQLKDHPQAEVLVYEALRPFQLEQHSLSLLKENQNGAQFFGETHQLLVHGSQWLIKPLSEAKIDALLFSISDKASFYWSNWKIEAEKIEYDLNKSFASNQLLLPLHISKLLVRTWQQGDKIALSGMKGRKKISDLFIDAKINIWDKNQWPIICNEQNEILWLPNIRVSRFVNIEPADNAAWLLTVSHNDKGARSI